MIDSSSLETLHRFHYIWNQFEIPLKFTPANLSQWEVFPHLKENNIHFEMRKASIKTPGCLKRGKPIDCPLVLIFVNNMSLVSSAFDLLSNFYLLSGCIEQPNSNSNSKTGKCFSVLQLSWNLGQFYMLVQTNQTLQQTFLWRRRRWITASLISCRPISDD